ncbi:MAG: Ppx/GppA family phosphatase [Rhodospirillales bacterium]|nr:Ppx/GppA family phosphatase [Rhodospirillales bacterium]
MKNDLKSEAIRVQIRPNTANTQRDTYAAIDLGTNNCRLLVACPDNSAPGGLRVIDGFSRIVRLGEGLSASGRLSDTAIARTTEALKICANKIESRGVCETRAVATEACRQAANDGDFFRHVHQQTGITLKTITSKEEVELTLAGCVPLLTTEHARTLMFDIGGGSTEVMWVETNSSGHACVIDFMSLPYGVVSLAEEFGRDALPSDVFETIIARIDTDLAPFEDRHHIAQEIDSGNVHVLGTSGTVTTMGAIYLDLPRYDRARIDGLSIRVESIHAICGNLIALDYETRNNHPCIGPGRADLMVMGCAILTAICRRWPASHLTAADRGIREGLLLDMMAPGRAVA